MKKLYCVYILANHFNTSFYIGVTDNLYRRLQEHKDKINKGFTSKYNISKLVYVETTESIEAALNREKQLKNWHRKWKINLIEKVNPMFKDLSADYGKDSETSSE